jgi:hypothetical protein
MRAAGDRQLRVHLAFTIATRAPSRSVCPTHLANARVTPVTHEGVVVPQVFFTNYPLVPPQDFASVKGEVTR